MIEEVGRDDGVELSRRLTLEGKLATGEPLPPIEVSTDEFARGDWPLTHWGTRAVVYAGQGNKDHLRAALQLCSGCVPRRTVRAFTGWCQFEGMWAYLHAGGAIGPEGPLEHTAVDLPAALAEFRLPEPPTGTALRAAVRGSLDLDGGRKLAPDGILLPVQATTYRAVLPGADFSTHLCGRTGTFKTELAALAQQHWGPDLHAKNLPANWSSTGNALETIAFAAKDALLVVDDFAPAGSTADISRYHREADRLLRGQGNRSGRQRLRPDGTPRPAKPPRGVILSTGEDVPKGHSLRARLLVVEVGRDDVDVDRLTAYQRAAADGLYARALAGYLRWLAPRYERVRDELKAEVERLRAKITADLGAGQHRRTPTLVADLLAGYTLFLQFAREVEAINVEEAEDLHQRCRAALMGVADKQVAHQEESDPCDRYLALLPSVLSSGRAHLADAGGGRPAIPPQVSGWRAQNHPDDPSAGWLPQGRCVGWVVDEDLFLDPEAAFAEVQRLASEQGDSLPVTRETLHKRLHERHLLVSTDVKRKKLLVRHTLGGSRRYVLHLRAGQVLGLDCEGPMGPRGPDCANPRESGPLDWAFASPARENGPMPEAQKQTLLANLHPTLTRLGVSFVSLGVVSDDT